MKKLSLFLFAFFFVFSLFSQEFEDYFVNKTLRINYLHIGNYNTNHIQLDNFYYGGTWNGTIHSLIEPNRYGDMLFEVFDAENKELILVEVIPAYIMNIARPNEQRRKPALLKSAY